MIALLVGVLAAALHASPAAGRALKHPAPPPPALNVVHHRLKRGAAAGYQALEASIVAAYERARAPLYWTAFQSTRDPRDVLYLNAFETPEDLARAGDAYRALEPSHPELARLTARLQAMIETQSSLLTTHHEEIAYTRPDVDFATMRALMLVTFRVRPGHEGQFVDAVRTAAGGGAPWLVYEAKDESTFVLLSPLRSRAEARRAVPIPRAIREVRRAYRRADVEVYALSPAMSRVPVAAPARPKAH